LPLTVVLWLLLLRALGIELRHQSQSPLWQDLWDAVFSAASALLAVFLGAALGNLVRGLPLDENGEFFEPLWTDFRVGEHTGILDWYTLLVGATAAAALALHGALWLNLRLTGELAARARHAAARLWIVTAPLAIVTTVASAVVQPQLVTNLTRCPQGVLFPFSAALGLGSARWFLSRAPARAFFGSTLLIAGLVLSAAYAMFPYALAARVSGRALTLSQVAAQSETLRGMFLWWLPGIALAAAYSFFIYSRLPASIAPDREDH
jgi:cytochrome d ubiquinol oxidase subunit II